MVAFPYSNSETSEKGIKRNIPSTSFENNKIPRNKFNQGREISVQLKLQCFVEKKKKAKVKKTQPNRKTY